ncbi:MAG: DUF167 domain-containing protein [Candidatus Dormibacteria bacterium]
MRVSVRVHPDSRRAAVGGRYGSGEPPVLSVWVTAPAVDGSIRLLSGARSRSKVFEVDGADPGALARLLES